MLQLIFGYRAKSPIPNINALELQRLIADEKDLVIIDVRSPFEYEHDGHIHGSRLLPLSALMQRVNELPADRPVVFVCRSGNRSQVACEQLSRLGYTNVSNFRGGMIAWKQAGLPVD